jgi:myo-inositol-1(or 4)-monophosphatase
LPEFDPLADQLEAVVRESGALALSLFRTPIRTWTKGKNSPVSEADVAVDALLRTKLTAAAPDYGWLSEESVDDRSRLSTRRVWIVDPIDGTSAFVAGLPDWTISAALVEDGRPILGALYAPVENAMLTAAAGAGTFCNGTRLVIETNPALRGLRVAGPKYSLAALNGLVPDLVPIPRIHSLALRLARVAQGTIDVALASGQSRDWDLAAADLLVHEAQGMLTTIGGDRLTYNRPDPTHGALVASGRERHAAVRALLRQQPEQFR